MDYKNCFLFFFLLLRPMHSHLQARCNLFLSLHALLGLTCSTLRIELLTSAVVPHWDQGRHHHPSRCLQRTRLNCFLLLRWARRLTCFPNYLCMCLASMQTDAVLSVRWKNVSDLNPGAHVFSIVEPKRLGPPCHMIIGFLFFIYLGRSLVFLRVMKIHISKNVG